MTCAVQLPLWNGPWAWLKQQYNTRTCLTWTWLHDHNVLLWLAGHWPPGKLTNMLATDCLEAGHLLLGSWPLTTCSWPLTTWKETNMCQSVAPYQYIKGLAQKFAPCEENSWTSPLFKEILNQLPERFQYVFGNSLLASRCRPSSLHMCTATWLDPKYKMSYFKM